MKEGTVKRDGVNLTREDDTRVKTRKYFGPIFLKKKELTGQKQACLLTFGRFV